MALSPMMKEYMRMKESYPDSIVFYRVGDFYEMFMDDALTASKELELTLTGKDCGLPERAPMCGVPHHAADTYIDRLVKKGYSVAICEQVEDPKLAKGLVKRDVIRVVTPGTNISDANLKEDTPCILFSVDAFDDAFGIAYTDISTGVFMVTQVEDPVSLVDEIVRNMPAEVICNESFLLSGITEEPSFTRYAQVVRALDESYFRPDKVEIAYREQFGSISPDALGLGPFPLGKSAGAALLLYLFETQKQALPQITSLTPYRISDTMVLDQSAFRNLELIETLRDGNKKGSLFGVLDRTRTAMGARRLQDFIKKPLIKKEDVEARLDAVETLYDDVMLCDELREYLTPIYDLERLTGKIALHTATPRDLYALQRSLAMLPPILQTLQGVSAGPLGRIYDALDPMDDICDLIERTITEDPPLSSKEGGVIRDGFSSDVDEYRRADTEGKTWLSDLEAKERDTLGIPSLKIKFSRVFGYCFEITNTYRDKVPDRFIRRQTLTNAERFTSEELKSIEDKILGSREKLLSLEYMLFCELRDRVEAEIPRIQHVAQWLATLDVVCSLAYVARKNRYVRPVISDDGALEIKGGRHPVVEQMLDAGSFIKNDTFLSMDDARVAIITGPNMAGKSTYMRQTALIALMAQIGSFVPADEARIGLVDRIFTRIGASDDLAAGQSTFMVEMMEVSSILRSATKRSLLILDEIGRGTSTYDGLAIAWAVLEYIADEGILGAKTMFATHYHELTDLEGTLPGVINYHVAVKEQGTDIVFLRKIMHGGADRSYGVEVARLAGVPDVVTQRASVILSALIKDHRTDEEVISKVKQGALSAADLDRGASSRDGQISLFDLPEEHPVVSRLRMTRPEQMTPLEALTLLTELVSACQGETP